MSDRDSGVSGITRSFAGLAAGEAAARGIAFIGTLLVARRLGPSMYGIIGVASGILLYCQQVADAGIELSGVPAVARDRAHATRLVSATITFRTILAAALTVAVLAVGLAIMPQPDGAVLAIYALSLVAFGASTRWVLIGFDRTGGVAMARVAGELLGLAILVAAVRDVGDVAVVPFAFVAATALASLGMLLGVRRLGLSLAWRPDWATARPLFDRAPHLVGFTLLGLLLFNFDLIYLRYVAGSSDAGHYAAAYTFVAFTANLSLAWSHSVLPALARLDGKPRERDALYGTTLALGFAVTLPVAVGGILVSTPLVRLVFGDGFGPAADALRWLLPAVPLSALREVATAALVSSPGGERRLLRINAVSVAINVLLVVPVVPVYGMVGAAAVTVLTEAVRLGMALHAARRAGFAPPPPMRFLRPLAAAAAMAAAVLALGDRALPILVAVGVAAYALGLTATGAVSLGDTRSPRLRL